MNTVLAIFLGGGLGSLARFGVSKLFYNPNFPIGTLITNVLSCIILGVFTFFFLEKNPNAFIKALILIGFCGGFSTFSTFSFETFDLIKSGNHLIATANVLISVLVCLGVIYLIYYSKL